MAVPAPAGSLLRGHARCAIIPDRPAIGQLLTAAQVTAVAAGLAFPHAAQAIRIVRRRRPRSGKNSKK